jgi:hypothetical protein
LRPLLASHSFLTIYPEACAAYAPDLRMFTQILLLASEYLIPINTMHISRFASHPICGDEAASSPLRDGELRIFRPAGGATIVPESARLCRAIGSVAVCSRNEQQLAGLDRPAIIATNTKISAIAAEESGLLVSGWSLGGKEGTWTDGDGATLAGWLSGPISGPARLKVWGHSIAPEPGGQQLIYVIINETLAATWSLTDFESTDQYADIPHDVELAGQFTIRFLVEKPVRPIDRHMNTDARLLGLCLDAFQIEDAR